MVVEDILDLDSVCFVGENEWDRQFRESSTAKKGQINEEREAARIEEQLDRWREMLPVHLTPSELLSPLPHVFIGLAVSVPVIDSFCSAEVRLVARYSNYHASFSFRRSHAVGLINASAAV